MRGSNSGELPSIYAWFVRLALRPWLTEAERHEVVVDLEELRAAHTANTGRRGLARYTWRQVLQYPWRLARSPGRAPLSIPDSRNPTMDNLLSDLRMAGRTLRRSPLLALTVVAILGLAICANATIYSVVHAVLITPLPYPQPDRVVTVWLADPDGSHSRLAPGTLLDARGADVLADADATAAPRAVQVAVYDNAPSYITFANDSALELTVGGCPLPDVPMASAGGQLFRGELPGNLVGDVSYLARSSDRYANTGTTTSIASLSCVHRPPLPRTLSANGKLATTPWPALFA